MSNDTESKNQYTKTFTSTQGGSQDRCSDGCGDTSRAEDFIKSFSSGSCNFGNSNSNGDHMVLGQQRQHGDGRTNVGDMAKVLPKRRGGMISYLMIMIFIYIFLLWLELTLGKCKDIYSIFF